MARVTILVAAVVAAFFSPSGSAQPVHVGNFLLSHHAETERVELLFAVRLAPPGLASDATTITYQLELLDGDKYVLNVAETTTSVAGFAKFDIAVGEIKDGYASLVVNSGDDDQEFCCVKVSNDDRAAYQVEVSARFLAGRESPVPVPQSGVATVTLVAPDGSTTSVEVSVFNRFVFEGDVQDQG